MEALKRLSCEVEGRIGACEVLQGGAGSPFS